MEIYLYKYISSEIIFIYNYFSVIKIKIRIFISISICEILKCYLINIELLFLYLPMVIKYFTTYFVLRLYKA